MKVLLVCSGGMSSAIVVKSLTEAGEKHGKEMEVKAVGTAEFPDEVKKGYDVSLVAPQIRYRFDEMTKAASAAGVPCALIEPRAYSPLGGERLFKQALELFEK